MKLNNSHKALVISLLIAISVLLSLFNFSIIKQNEAVTETLIDITPEDLLKDNPHKDLELKDAFEKTNKGFNDTKEYKHFAQAFKPIAPPKDYDNPRLRNRKEQDFRVKKESEIENNSNIKNEELTTFKSVSSILNKHKKASQQTNTEASINKNSSIIYSLIGRKDTYLPIPIYLCETNGIIIVNITVNAKGEVISTTINSSSSSPNECLQKHALEFAKKARFDRSRKSSQIGTITFNFEGKL